MPTPAFDTKAGTVENDCAGGKMGTSNLCNLAETNHLLQYMRSILQRDCNILLVHSLVDFFPALLMFCSNLPSKNWGENSWSGSPRSRKGWAQLHNLFPGFLLFWPMTCHSVFFVNQKNYLSLCACAHISFVYAQAVYMYMYTYIPVSMQTIP